MKDRDKEVESGSKRETPITRREAIRRMSALAWMTGAISVLSRCDLFGDSGGGGGAGTEDENGDDSSETGETYYSGGYASGGYSSGTYSSGGNCYSSQYGSGYYSQYCSGSGSIYYYSYRCYYRYRSYGSTYSSGC